MQGDLPAIVAEEFTRSSQQRFSKNQDATVPKCGCRAHNDFQFHVTGWVDDCTQAAAIENLKKSHFTHPDTAPKTKLNCNMANAVTDTTNQVHGVNCTVTKVVNQVRRDQRDNNLHVSFFNWRLSHSTDD